MAWGVLADAVMVVHFAFILFVIAGGMLAWRWHWIAWPHGAALVWALAAITVGVSCPLTGLEKHLLSRAGESGYDGGFIDRYLEGVIYPSERAGELRLAIGAVVVGSYLVLVRRLVHTHPSREARAWGTGPGSTR